MEQLHDGVSRQRGVRNAAVQPRRALAKLLQLRRHQVQPLIQIGGRRVRQRVLGALPHAFVRIVLRGNEITTCCLRAQGWL
jgi:hypothetical protein